MQKANMDALQNEIRWRGLSCSNSTSIFLYPDTVIKRVAVNKLTRDSRPNLHGSVVETGKKPDAMHGFGFDGTDFYKHYRIWTSMPILLTLATYKT